MAAAFTAVVDLSKADDFFKKFLNATGKTAAEVVRQQAKLLLRSRNSDNGIIKFTPPQGMDEAKKRGDAAVRRDIHRVFVSKESIQEIAKRSKVRGLRQAFRNKDANKILQIVNNQQQGSVRVKGYRRKDGTRVADYTQQRQVSSLNNNRLGYISSVSDRPDRSVHKSRQDNRKHVRRRQWSQIVLDKPSLPNYIKEIQKRVGTLKAGWRKAAKELGVSLPPFVNAAPRGSGDISVKLGGENPTIVMTNSTPNASRVMQKVLDFVTAGRDQAMAANLEKILSAQASKT
jgi:hypothetical protein